MWSTLVSNPRRGRQVLGLFILMLGVGALGLPAMGQMGGVTVVDLQLVRTTANAVEMIAQLGPSGVDAAQMAHYVDFAYLVAYGLAFSAACMVLAARAADRGKTRLAAIGPRVAWLPVIAAALDAVEDVAILLMLDGRTEQPWPAIAFGCSVLKFALLAVVFVYLVVAVVAALSRPTAP